jgi:hypothetical protein
MNLTLRVVGNDPKLAPLTHTEVDYNFLEVSSSVAQVANSSLVAASLSADVLRFRKGDGSTFDIDFREFVIEPETGSLYLSSSIDLNAQTLLFRKGNGTDDTVDLSVFVTQNESGSLMYSASLDFTTNVFTFHRDNGNYTIDISELTGLTLYDTIASGSFSGSFEGDGSGLTGVVLDHTVASGLGIKNFLFDGGSDQIVTLDTGSTHFTEGVREKVSAADTAGASGISLSYNQSTGEFSGSVVNASVTIGNSSVDLGDTLSTIDGVQLTDVSATGSFTGSFEGDFILSKNVSNGSGIEAFQFDGLIDQIVTLDTGSSHFTEGVREKINVTDTTGASGVELTYDEATGNIQATLVNSTVTFGNTTVDLGNSSNVINGLQLTATNATGSFSGSFEGDFILSKNISNGLGLESFSFDGQADKIVTLATGSAHFLEGVKKKLNTEGVHSGSVQVDHDATTNFVANEHINHTSVDITAGLGLSGGGDISTTRTLTLDTGSTHFNDGVKDKLNSEQVISGSVSGQVDHDLTVNFVANEHIDHTDVDITAGLGMLGGGDISLSRTLTLDTGSTHFNDGVKKKLNTEQVISGSVSGQVDHDLTINFVTNEHIDHSTVSVSPGLGLSGGGDITTTRTLTLDTGSTHFNNGVKAKLNAEGLLSGSSTITSTSQGTLTYTSNGVATNVDLGVETTDNVVFGSVAVNATLHSTAILQADSTTKGFLPPRMTKTQREAITNPATGLVVYQTDGSVSIDSPFGSSTIEMKGLWYYDGTSWQGPLTT